MDDDIIRPAAGGKRFSFEQPEAVSRSMEGLASKNDDDVE